MGGLGRRELVLGLVLLGLAGFYLWWNFAGEDPQEAARGPRGEAADALPPGADIPVIALARDTGTATVREDQRNLFSYSRSPEEIAAERAEAQRIRQLQEEAERRRREEEERRAAAAAAAAALAAANPPPPKKPDPPPVNFRFIGYMGEPRDPKERLIVLSDATPGGDVFVARKGQVVADKFKVVDIDFESVTIGFVNPEWSGQTRTLRIGG